MSEHPQSPRNGSPADDDRINGPESAHTHAPETSEGVSNLSDRQPEDRANTSELRPKRVLKGTGALLSRITGILRRAAEEAPGDPVNEVVLPETRASDLAKPELEENEIDGNLIQENSSEKNFLDSLMDQPRRGTGQLRLMVTGVLRGPEGDEQSGETGSLEATEAPAAERLPAAEEMPKIEEASASTGSMENLEDFPEFQSRVDSLGYGTGSLRSTFTGALRSADDLESLRAEMETDAQPEAAAFESPAAGEPAGRAEEDYSEIEELLTRKDAVTGELRFNNTGSLRRLDDLEALRSDALSFEEMPDQTSAAESPQYVPMDQEIHTHYSGANDEALLEDRFAMLGMEPEEDVVQRAAFAPESEAPAPVMPDIPVEFAENVAVETTESPAQTAQPEEAAEEPPVRGKSGKRSTSSVEDLRQALVEEESKQRRRTTGGLFHRITGTLRRSTDNLRKGRTGPVSQPEPEKSQLDEVLRASDDLQAVTRPLPDLEEEQWEEPVLTGEELISQFDSGVVTDWERTEQEIREEQDEGDWMAEIRQSGAAVEEEVPATTVQVEETSAEPEPPVEDARPRTITGRLVKIVTGILRGSEARKKSTDEADISDDLVTGRLQRTMVTGSLKRVKTDELAPEEAQDAGEPLEGVPEAPAAEPEEEQPQRRGITGQLRSFITGILHSSEDPNRAQTGPLQTGDLSDQAATERFQQNMPGSQRRTSRRTSERRETFDAQSLRQQMIDGSPTAGVSDQPAITEEDLLRGLDQPEPQAGASQSPVGGNLERDLPNDRFGMFFGDDVVSPAYASSGITGGLDEQLESDVAAAEEGMGSIRPEDIWGGMDQQQPDIWQPAEPRKQEENVWYVPEDEEFGEEETPRKTGSLFGDISEEELTAAYLGGQAARREAEEHLAGDQMSVQDLRSIALENYSEVPEEMVGSATEAPAGADAETAGVLSEPERKKGLVAWFASLTILQKILVGEVVLIVVLVPLLILSALRQPAVVSPAVNYPVPNALPAGVPYPTGLTLTGGWHFDLNKSTFVEGKWAPAGSEWLEGTEVRRVVALPWNPQTEAVVQTFQPGDPITVLLSNQDEVTYKIVSIERRASTESDFLADRKLSLVIVLYDEESEDRWVITCEK